MDQAVYDKFLVESKRLADEMADILTAVEKKGAFEQAKLEEYSNLVDRIMGGAQSLAMAYPSTHPLHIIGDYCSFCKKISKKTAQIDSSDQFYNVCVAILQETTSTLKAVLQNIDKPTDEIKKVMPEGMTDRLRFVFQQFSDGGAGAAEMNQSDIDELMKKLGM